MLAAVWALSRWKYFDSEVFPLPVADLTPPELVDVKQFDVVPSILCKKPESLYSGCKTVSYNHVLAGSY